MTTVIIGGGWSGLAAAIRLLQQGESVHLIEASRHLGGRARNVPWQDITVDNGQHLMIGAYQRLLALLDDIGADPDSLFERRPLSLTIYDPSFPPLHLNAGRVLPWPLSMAWQLFKHHDTTLLFAISRVLLMARKQSKRADIPLSNWLALAKQPDRLIRQLWEPLCLATLNTPLEQASATVFSRVLVETFKHRHYADLLIPRHPLGDTLPACAADYIAARNGKVHMQTRATALRLDNHRICGVETDKGEFIQADDVIVATGQAQATKLLSPLSSSKPLQHFPIATVYLQYPAAVKLPAAMIGMSGTTSQWLFDRQFQRPGLVAVVISGPGEHEKLSKQELAQHVAVEVHQLLPQLPRQASDSLVIREKQATFSCDVNIQGQRPGHHTATPGLWLAGDYVSNPFPATLEGAIVNGEQAVNQLIEQRRVSR